LDTAGKRRRSD